MSESVAVRPFFVICVLSLSLSVSDSSCFLRSIFWTLPVTSVELEADAVEPVVSLPMVPLVDPLVDPPIEPLVELPAEPLVEPPVAPLVEPPVELPVELPIEPLVSVPVAEDPDDPVCDGSFEGSFDGSVVVEPRESPAVGALVPDCAAAGMPAKSSPAVPRPATKPHPIFM